MPFLLIALMPAVAFALFGLAEWCVCVWACGEAGASSPVGIAVHAVLGLLIGLPFALAARIGSRPKRSAGSLVRPVVVLVVLMAVFAVAAAVVGAMLAAGGHVGLPPEAQERIPRAKWGAVQACGLAHTAGHYVGCVGGGMLVAWAWVSRKRPTPRRSTP